MSTAISRPDWTPGGSTDDLAAWYTAERRRNPNVQLPRGYSVSADGTVTRDQPNFLMRNPWLIPLMGVGAGLGGSAIAGTGLFAGSGGTAAAAGAGAAVPTEAAIPTTYGIGSGAATTGASAATGSTLARTMQLLGGAAPIVGGLLRGNGSGNSLGSNIQQVMQAVPQLGQMMNLQLGQAQRADPLHQSLVTLAQRLLPNSAR